MPPFGFNFNKIEEKKEKSPREIIDTVTTEDPKYHEEEIRKILSPEMLKDVEDFIGQTYDKKILKIINIFNENGKLGNLENVARLNIDNWAKNYFSMTMKVLDSFAKINIDLKTEGVIKEVDNKLEETIKYGIKDLENFADFLETVRKLSIPINIKSIESAVDINFLKERLKFRQVTGINKFLSILSDVGISFDISECVDEIKEGVIYSFNEDYYDKHFVGGLIETVNLVKGTKIESELKNFLTEKLDIQNGAWRKGTTDESKKVIIEAVLKSN